MKTIQNIIVGLFVVANIAFTGNCAQAQDARTEMVVGTEVLDVTLKSTTDVCVRVTPETVSCTRIEGGKATKTFTCQVTSTGLKCTE